MLSSVARTTAIRRARLSTSSCITRTTNPLPFGYYRGISVEASRGHGPVAFRPGVTRLPPSFGQKDHRSSGSITAIVLRSSSWRSSGWQHGGSSFGPEGMTVRAFATMPPAPAPDQQDDASKGGKDNAAASAKKDSNKGASSPDVGGGPGTGAPGVPSGSLSKSQQHSPSAETYPNNGAGKVGEGPTPTAAPGSSAKAADNATVAALRNPVSMGQRVTNLLESLPSAIASGTSAFAAWCAQFSRELASDPRRKTKEIWAAIKHEANHYWVGSKLLWADVKIATKILGRLAMGHRLTRREHMQMVRTTTDLLRLVPMSVFVLVPFMELLLPVALKLFPNMLPSTFEGSYQKEEAMKRELQTRLAMAGFMKDMLREMAKDVKSATSSEASASEVTSFMAKAKRGSVANEDIFKFAKLFKDDLTLDNMSRTQLVTMCTFMNVQPYGADAFVRFKLRSHIRDLQTDDQRIVFEGIDSLDRRELQEACRERGMRALGLTKDELKQQLRQWIDLSQNRQVPISLLILSRSFALDSSFQGPGADFDESTRAQAEANALAQSISSLEESIVTEVVLESATAEERKSAEIRNLRLESYETQSELIAEEKSDLEEDLKIARENEAKAKSKKSEAAAAVAAAVSKADASAAAARQAGASSSQDDSALSREDATADATKHAGLVAPLQKTLAEANNGFAMAQVLSGEAQARFDAEVAAATAAENKAAAKAGTTAAAAEAAAAAAANAANAAANGAAGASATAPTTDSAAQPSSVRPEAETIAPEVVSGVVATQGEAAPKEKEAAAVAAATVPEAGSTAATGDALGAGAGTGGEEDKKDEIETEELNGSKEEEDEGSGNDELTVEELKALANFAGPSAVEEEKETFAKLKASEEDLAAKSRDQDEAETMVHATASEHAGATTSSSLEMDVAAAPADSAAATAARLAKEALPDEKPTPDPFATASDSAEYTAGGTAEKRSDTEGSGAPQPPSARARDGEAETGDAGALSSRASRKEREQAEAFYQGDQSASKEQSAAELQAALAAAAQEAAAAGADLAAAWQFKHEQDAATAAGYAAAVAAAPKADYAMGRLSQQLASMMDKLETDIAKVDVAIGEKFHVLDADHDGRLSEGELTEVLQTMFRTKVTEEEAKNKVRKLMESIDMDCDGVVTVDELRTWVRNQARQKEVEVHAKTVEGLRKKQLAEADDKKHEEDKHAEEVLEKVRGGGGGPL